MPDSTSRPLRRDAERNRQRILQAAREEFAERGLSATLDDIAHRADVGVGTVYRRFADKDALIDALFEERLDEVAAVAEEASRLTDPLAGLTHAMTGLLELIVADRGLKELLESSGRGQDKVERSRARITPIITAVLERAQAAGVARDDIGIGDLVLMQHAVAEAASWAHEADPDAWRRMHAVVLDGLRPGPGTTPLPGAPLDDADLAVAMRSLGRRRR